jgi:RNA polymerase sigma-70 factor (ECF subfamily)
MFDRFRDTPSQKRSVTWSNFCPWLNGIPLIFNNIRVTAGWRSDCDLNGDMTAAPFTFYAEPLRRCRSGLLDEARNGNPEAFAEMVSPYLPTLYRRARGLTGNTADAQDVSQEAVLKAWSRLEQFAGKQDESIDDFRAWISRIAANTSIDLLRQRRDGKIASLDQRQGESEETLGSGIASQQQDPEECCARRELGRLLAKAIAQLPPDLRQACLLRDVLHYSTQEVAGRLGISVVAVRLRLFRAHRRLREKLQDSLRPTAPLDRSRVRPEYRQNVARRFASMTAAGYVSGD